MTHLLNILHGESKTPLVAEIVFLTALVLDVVARHLIYRVVS